jgi:hypothetical protein
MAKIYQASGGAPQGAADSYPKGTGGSSSGPKVDEVD